MLFIILVIWVVNVATITLQMAHIRAVVADAQTRGYMIARLSMLLISFSIAVVLFWLLINCNLLATIQNLLGPLQNDYTLLLAVLVLIYLINTVLNFGQMFLIEQRFGFNNMSVLLFVVDSGKKLLLYSALFLPVAFLSVWLAATAGELWWLVIWCLGIVVLIGYSLCSQFIARAFNSFQPLLEGELRTRVEQLTKNNAVELAEIFIVDKSQRSSHSNAYFAGVGRAKRIVMDDTLTQQLNDDQIIAVLAHELGHYKLNHELKLYSILGGIILLMLFMVGQFIEHTTMSWVRDYSPIIILVLSYPILYFVLQPLLMVYARHCEYDADSFAIEQCSSKWLHDALVKLTEANKMVQSSNRWYRIFYESHPTISERLLRLKESK